MAPDLGLLLGASQSRHRLRPAKLPVRPRSRPLRSAPNFENPVVRRTPAPAETQEGFDTDLGGRR